MLFALLGGVVNPSSATAPPEAVKMLELGAEIEDEQQKGFTQQADSPEDMNRMVQWCGNEVPAELS